ncbi:MAG: glycoside hydrolase family 31 protein [Chloroflexota bacterium]
MQIVQLKNVLLQKEDKHGVALKGERGEQFRVSVLDDDLIRVQHMPEGKTRFNRTWAIVDSTGDVPREGRFRNDYASFSLPSFEQTSHKQQICIKTNKLQLIVSLDECSIGWKDAGGQLFASDLAERAYPYDVGNDQVYHYMMCQPDELYYGFGERTGELNKRGRRMRFYNVDAMGYNARSSDPLYKHWPFHITFNPALNIAYGLFYDNLSTAVFDLGKEIDNYYPAFRSYRADGGDVDYYMIYGPTIEEVVEKFTKLTGRMILPPRWSLGYLGSTMAYTDMPDAQEQLKNFVDLCEQHEIPCDLFHLSSGYSMGEDGKRYAFEWNHNRVPDPLAMSTHFRQAGMQLAANIKPCLLTSHPRFEEVAELDGFINSAETAAPELAMFWGGQGAHLDFTNPAAYEWWQERVKTSLLENGIDATWNDNNEYAIENDTAVCHGFGEPIPLGLIRPLHPLLMTRASYEAQLAHKPNERPYLIIRSGCVGIQRYAQTWTGDNRTNWETLQYNIPMGLGAGLSGIANTGHDVGGFAGEKPTPELFVRWVQNGIFHPRFTIHSWNDDQTANEPWMYPEVLPFVREAIQFRYRLLPYLYSLFYESAQTGHPIIRPMVYHFSHDPKCHAESFDFMLGPSLLVASVVEQGATSRAVYLPSGTDWCDFYTGQWWHGGQTIELEAPLDRMPLLVRAGGIVPMGKAMRHFGAEPDDWRQILLFPHPESGSSCFTFVEDDGVSLDYQRGEVCEITLTLTVSAEEIHLTIEKEGQYSPPYSQMELILPPDERRTLVVDNVLQSWLDDENRRHIEVQVNLG